MGSRKDLIKSSLGISDYPWSSDDDLEGAAQAAADEASRLRRLTEARSNEPDAPGTSGIPPQQPLQQQLHQQQQQLHQQQPIHQQQSQHRHQQQHHQQQQVHPQANPPTRRSHARLEREIFWSVLNSPPRRIPSNGPRVSVRSSEIPVSYVSRVNHIPAPELRDRGAERPRPDIQRILAFKRLTRNMGPLRHRGHIAIPVTRVNPGVIVPSEANSSIRINRHLPYRRYVRTGASGPIPFRNDFQNFNYYVDLNSPEGSGLRRGRASPDGDDQGLPLPTPMHLQAAQNEVNNNPIPLPVHPIILDEGNVEQDEPLEGDLLSEANNNSRANVSLGDIVPIDLDNSDVQAQMGSANEDDGRDVRDVGDVRDVRSARDVGDVRDVRSARDVGDVRDVRSARDVGDVRDVRSARDVGDVRDGPGTSGARFAADYHTAGADANMPSTSDGPSDASAQQPLDQNGVRRKRSEDREGAEPHSVVEFNQNLLRLLECPVCLEWMEPPMSQCRRGHLVCVSCRARLAACPVCRTTFSSVRNRAMEGVAEMLRYPCRHGCGREVRLRERAPHEASCAARKYQCPAPPCDGAPPLPRAQLATHFQSQHMTMMKVGRRHRFLMKVNSEQHVNWLILAMEEYFHLRIDVDIRTWGVLVYVSYIGPKCDAKNFTYEVSIDGEHNQRKLAYARTTHSDLENSSVNMGRQDCFHLTLDQALNFIRFKNRRCDADKFLEFNVEISKVEQPAGGPLGGESDS